MILLYLRDIYIYIILLFYFYNQTVVYKITHTTHTHARRTAATRNKASRVASRRGKKSWYILKSKI